VRNPAWRFLIRSLLDPRLSRLSLAVLAAASALATIVILTSGDTRSPAQIAALAALRARPVTVAETPRQSTAAATPAAPAATSASSPSTAGSSGSDAPSSVDASGATTSVSTTTASAGTSTSTPSAGSTAGGATSSATTPSTSSSAGSSLPKVGHVFEIALSTTSYAGAFGHGSAAPYLRSLEARATLLSGYESLGAGELADYVAMVSGQAPNADTRDGCATYAEFPQGAAAETDGLVPGTGCVYPETALTIGDQVSSSGHVWKAYIDDMGTQTCSHPNSDAVDDAALPGTEPGYDTRHNPFIYFHSLLDLGDCATDDQDLSHLGSALGRKSSTAAFSFIAPGACDDAAAPAAAPVDTPGATASGTTTSATTTSTSVSAPATTSGTTPTSSTASSTASTPASSTSTSSQTTSTPTSTTTPGQGVAGGTCPAGQPVGIAAEDAFLKQWVPKILGSAAYKDNGVLVIAFAGTGHGTHPIRTGAIVLSRYARKGKTVRGPYGPYSLLRSTEDMLGYTPLAHSKAASSFAAAVLAKTV
jgi:phosphatidylinositol-3-phosphatase